MTPPPWRSNARRWQAPFVLLLLLLMGGRAAAAYPDRPVVVIVPFPAGAAADAAMRVIARHLSLAWGQQVVVDNRPGTAGMKSGTTAAPDGHTLLLGAGSGIVTAPLVHPALPYKATDLIPITRLTTSTSVLTVTPSLPAKTLDQLIALAKARPGQLNYVSSGMGAPNHLGMEWIQGLTGTSMTHIPYRGAAPAMKDLIAGEVQVGLNAVPSVLGALRAGKLTAIAVASEHRVPTLPDVPTLAEAGLPGVVIDVWYGLFAPVGTPAQLVGKIGADVRKVLLEPEVSEALARQGGDAAPLGELEFARFIAEETALWARIIRQRGLKFE